MVTKKQTPAKTRAPAKKAVATAQKGRAKPKVAAPAKAKQWVVPAVKAKAPAPVAATPKVEAKKPADTAALTPKQEAFAVAFMTIGSPSQAYKVAYDAKTMSSAAISVEASRLLQNPTVALRIRELKAQAADSAVMTKADVLMEAMRLARFDVRRLYDADGAPIPIHELDADTAAAIQAVEVMEEFKGSGENRVFVGYTKKYKVADKNAALDKLFKHFGLYEIDNKQKTDPMSEFLAELSARGSRLPTRGQA